MKATMTANRPKPQRSSNNQSSRENNVPAINWGGLELVYPNLLVAPPSWVGHIPFAFWIVEALRPNTIVELGVHSGNSYCAFLQAVQVLSLPAQCFGIDHWRGDEHSGAYGNEIYAELKAYHDPMYGTFSTLIQSTFQEALQYFSDGTIDLLHIDGLHTYESVREDFTSWLPKLGTRGVVLFHDINVHADNFGVWKFWQEVTKQYPHFEFIHAHGLGVAYVGREPLPEPAQILFGNDSDASVAQIRAYFARLGASILDRYASLEVKTKLFHSKEELRIVSESMTRQIGASNSRSITLEAELQATRKKLVTLEAELQAARKKLETAEAENARLKATSAATSAQQPEIERLHAHIVHIEAQFNAAELARQRIQLRFETELAAALDDNGKAADKITELERKLLDDNSKAADTITDLERKLMVMQAKFAIVVRQREALAFQNSQKPQPLASVVVARIHPRIKRIIPRQIKQYIKSRIF